MTDPKLLEVLRAQADQIATLQSKVAALELFTVYAFAEQTLRLPDAKDYASRFTAQFLGFAESQSDVSSPAFSQAVEGISTTVEKLVSGSIVPSKPTD